MILTTLISLGDIVGTGLNYVFWSICRCVFYCFRFVELLPFSVDFIVESIKTILRYNNAIISGIIEAIRKSFEFFGNVQTKASAIAETVTYSIVEMPSKVVLATENTFSSFYTITNKYMELVLVVLKDLFLSITDWIAEFVIYMRDYGFKIMLLVTKMTGDFLFILLNYFFDAVLYVSTYIITFADQTWGLLCSGVNPAVTYMASSGEVIAGASIAGFKYIVGFIYQGFFNIGVFGNNVWLMLMYLPSLFYSLLNNGLNYITEGLCVIFNLFPITGLKYIFERLVVIANIIPTLLKNLELQEFILGFFLSILFIGFTMFLIQHRNINDFPSINIANYLQQPMILLKIVYVKFQAYFSQHNNPNRNNGINNAHLINAEANVVYRNDENNTDRNVPHQSNVLPNTESITPCEIAENLSCVICQDGRKSVLLLPCKHLCVCSICIETIFDMPNREHKCPLCRKKIRDFIDVYM